MSETPSDDATGTGDESSEEDGRAVTAAASSTYKVLGELDDPSGAGVLGRNTASTDTPIAVEGAVPNDSAGWGLYTNDNARVAGTAAVNVIAFDDADGSGNAFAIREAPDGNLEVTNGSTSTHEFASNGDTNISGSFTENASL